MQDLDTPAPVHKVPRPFDPERARAQLQDLRGEMSQSGREDALELLHRADVEDMLICLFGNSPFLSRSVVRDPDFITPLFTRQAIELKHDLLAQIDVLKPATFNIAELMAHLRQLRSRIALMTAVADIGGKWSLNDVTQTLSEFADLSTEFALAHLMRDRLLSGDLSWPGAAPEAAAQDIAQGSGYFILGMGKLGAFELNYSSDIDLIVFYDVDSASYHGRKTLQDCFIGITRDLVRILQERTQEGYVFRTDLRLRPDAGATPVAISTEAAEVYYQSMGRNWERSAMIKARVIAGDRAVGADFVRAMTPFVWRRNLDFAALEDVHAMKARIHSHHAHVEPQARGQDVKLGHGGIREIEFFVQAQQLIAGGRELRLRESRTRDALVALSHFGAISGQDASILDEAYQYLRRVEHRLQMINDQQTHSIPEDDSGLAHISTFLGYDDVDGFEAELVSHLTAVQAHYDALFSEVRETESAQESSELGGLFSSQEPSVAAVDELQTLGFGNPTQAADVIQNWGSGRYRACRSERARQLLASLTPSILQTLAQTATPDQALARFDEFLGKLPSGVQLFSLFHANPRLLSLIADVMGSAPALADSIGRNPSLLDAVLSADFFDILPGREALEAELAITLDRALDFQDVLDLARRWANDRKFQIGVQTLQNTITVPEAYEAQTSLADAVIRGMLPKVQDEFAQHHGHIPGGELAVVGMGSLGGGEISFSSDLDLIFLYAAKDLSARSDGPRPLAASQYFARLGQRLINALTALTGEGRLYEVDMRLRPSGRAGPIAVTVESFEKYHSEQSWTWEHMALARARVVAGSQDLSTIVDAAIQKVLRQDRDGRQLLKDIAEMRGKLEEEFGTENPWGIKHVRGGLLDLEFISQYWQLLWAKEHPDILSPRTVEVFRRLKEQGLVQESLVDELIGGYTLQAAVRGFLRQCFGGDFHPREQGSDGIRLALAKAAGLGTFDVLEERLLKVQQDVRKDYDEIITDPASRLTDTGEPL